MTRYITDDFSNIHQDSEFRRMLLMRIDTHNELLERILKELEKE